MDVWTVEHVAMPAVTPCRNRTIFTCIISPRTIILQYNCTCMVLIPFLVKLVHDCCCWDHRSHPTHCRDNQWSEWAMFHFENPAFIYSCTCVICVWCIHSPFALANANRQRAHHTHTEGLRIISMHYNDRILPTTLYIHSTTCLRGCCNWSILHAFPLANTKGVWVHHAHTLGQRLTSMHWTYRLTYYTLYKPQHAWCALEWTLQQVHLPLVPQVNAWNPTFKNTKYTHTHVSMGVS